MYLEARCTTPGCANVGIVLRLPLKYIYLERAPVTSRDLWERKAADVLNRALADPPKQRFWRCEHYLSAIDNYYGEVSNVYDMRYRVVRPGCDKGCKT